MYSEVSKKYQEVSTILFNDYQQSVGEWTRNSRHSEKGEDINV